MSQANTTSVLLTGRAFPELGRLHQRMVAARLSRLAFSYLDGGTGQARIEVLFVTDENPMQFCILVIDPSSRSVVIERSVHPPGYRIDTYLGDQYGQLLDVLGIDRNRQGATPFKASKFFARAIANAPHRVDQGHLPPPEVVQRIRALDVEESDKIYFLCIRAHHQDGKHVTAANLTKTRALLGADIAEFCRRRNISTCWSSNPVDSTTRSTGDIIRRIQRVRG